MSLRELFVRGETYVQFHRRSATIAIGMFDPELGPGTGLPYGCGEDTDYLLRAANHGPVYRAPAIRVFHPCPTHKTIALLLNGAPMAEVACTCLKAQPLHLVQISQCRLSIVAWSCRRQGKLDLSLAYVQRQAKGIDERVTGQQTYN